jgi:hypothetical protein
MTMKRWVVECDGEMWEYRTREEAREQQRRVNGHPANSNIRKFGPYANVDGIARIIDRWYE